MTQPMDHLRGIAALLERQKSLKRCRHLLEAWGSQRLETLEKCISAVIEDEIKNPSEIQDMEARIDSMFESLNRDALHFQQLYYSERKHILYLDQSEIK